MQLLGNRLLVVPAKSNETESGLQLLSEAAKVDNEYIITHSGDGVEDERFTVGKHVIISDAIIGNAMRYPFVIDEKPHALITPDNIVGFPS